MKDIGRVFEPPEDRRRLKALLDGGGMSGDTHNASGVVDPARRHEHPDTLAKVFTDGLGDRAFKLKEFTEAFGDTGAHAGECKNMMEAWNEFPDTHAGARQPGQKIKLLLNGSHFGDDVSRLQTQFTDRMEQFATPAQRKLATRFAPHFDQEDPGPPWTLPQPSNNATTGVNRVVMPYILKRHVPKFVQRGMLDNNNSYFPVNTTEAQLAKIVGDAMAHPTAPWRATLPRTCRATT